MVVAWLDLFKALHSRNKEFVSVDARYDVKKDTRANEMTSQDSSAAVTPIPPPKAPLPSGRITPDYFGPTSRYQPPARSFSSPRPPSTPAWDARRTYAPPGNVVSHGSNHGHYGHHGPHGRNGQYSNGSNSSSSSNNDNHYLHQDMAR